MTDEQTVQGAVTADGPATHMAGESKRTIVAAYRQTRMQAQLMSTIRLRWRARRVHRATRWDNHRDLARLAALRDELRCRGVEAGPL